MVSNCLLSFSPPESCGLQGLMSILSLSSQGPLGQLVVEFLLELHLLVVEFLLELHLLVVEFLLEQRWEGAYVRNGLLPLEHTA